MTRFSLFFSIFSAIGLCSISAGSLVLFLRDGHGQPTSSRVLSTLFPPSASYCAGADVWRLSTRLYRLFLTLIWCNGPQLQWHALLTHCSFLRIICCGWDVLVLLRLMPKSGLALLTGIQRREILYHKKEHKI
jgi:hypothetical protein